MVFFEDPLVLLKDQMLLFNNSYSEAVVFIWGTFM